MKVLITGATGLIGQALISRLLEAGHDIHYLTRSSRKTQNSRVKAFQWDPGTDYIEKGAFDGINRIINLAGAPIAKRWTTGYKEELLQSRIQALAVLRDEIARNQWPVEQLISASAIGYYPSSETNYYTESMSHDPEDFLSELVRQWEDAADAFEPLGIDILKVRIGLVLSPDGGDYEKLAKPVKMFVGSAIGTGEQWQSWIHIDDMVGIMTMGLMENWSGVVNGVGPNPVRQQTLVAAIAKALRRPIILPNVPSVIIRLLLGEMSQIVLDSQRVSSEHVEQLGYHFKFPQLKSALEDIIKKPAK